MDTATFVGKVRDGHRVFSLRGSIVSPYFHTIDPRKTEPRRDIQLFLASMNLKALVTNYSVGPSAPQVSIYLESDDNTIKAGVTLPLAPTYTDDETAIQTTIGTAITSFCTGIGLPAPLIDWLVTTPTDLAAAIAAAIPVAPSSYQTIVTQTGTGAPAVSGSLAPTSTYPAGTTFTWARTGAGVYTLTASTAVFNTSGKTGAFVGSLANLNSSYKTAVTSSTVITITTAIGSLLGLGLLGLTATNTDGLLAGTMVYVQTYA